MIAEHFGGFFHGSAYMEPNVLSIIGLKAHTK